MIWLKIHLIILYTCCEFIYHYMLKWYNIYGYEIIAILYVELGIWVKSNGPLWLDFLDGQVFKLEAQVNPSLMATTYSSSGLFRLDQPICSIFNLKKKILIGIITLFNIQNCTLSLILSSLVSLYPNSKSKP